MTQTESGLLGRCQLAQFKMAFHGYCHREPPSSCKPILTVHEILYSPAVLEASEAIQIVLAQMQITLLQSIAVGEVTRGQHKNPLWYSYRKGR